MALKRDYTKKFELIPEGVYLARSFAVYDLGHQEIKWNDQVKIQPKFLVLWELNEHDKNGKPLTIGKTYTNSLAQNSTLRKDLESWFGKKLTDEDLGLFSPEKLIDKPCQLQVVHTSSGGKTYANVDTLMAVSKSMVIPPLTNIPVIYNIENEIPVNTPRWIEDKINKSKEKSNPDFLNDSEDGSELEPF